MDSAGVSDGVFGQKVAALPVNVSVVSLQKPRPTVTRSVLDKVPIEPCPRHGLPLAQTPLPLSVWPVSLRMSRHHPASKPPSYPTQVPLSSSVFSLLNTASQHKLARGLWKASEKDRTMPGSFLLHSQSSLRKHCSEFVAILLWEWLNYHNPRLATTYQTVPRAGWKCAAACAKKFCDVATPLRTKHNKWNNSKYLYVGRKEDEWKE